MTKEDILAFMEEIGTREVPLHDLLDRFFPDFFIFEDELDDLVLALKADYPPQEQ